MPGKLHEAGDEAEGGEEFSRICARKRVRTSVSERPEATATRNGVSAKDSGL